MKRTVRSRSTGADVVAHRFGAWTVAAMVAMAAPAMAQDYASGQDAYANRDWEAALRIWTEEAASGSAEAMLGLGNLLDFGLNGPADPEAAFGMYRYAALLGNAEAEFNIAVMLDSGVGTEIDKRAAAGWYSLAALDDFPRAQYNLGQMYAMGDGVPVNPRLALQWLEEAVDAIPVSRGLIDNLDMPADAALSAPDILQIVTLEDGDSPQARVAWSSGPGPENSRYRVEIADGADERAPRRIATVETTASAASIPLPDLSDTALVRVFQLTDEDYVASSWTGLDGAEVEAGSPATVRFQMAADDARGIGYAERIGSSLERSGLAVSYEVEDQVLEDSAVFYGYRADETLASNVADFLPGVSDGAASQGGDLDLGPGEIMVRIVFDGGGDPAR